MSTSILGKIIDENGKGLASLQVQALALNGIHGNVPLGVGTSDAGGNYAFPFTMAVRVSTIRVIVFDSVQRPLASQDVPETASVNLVASFSIASAVVQGLPVAQGDGSRIYVTEGNTVEFLIDDEVAWARLTDAVHAAKHQVHLLQFGYDISNFQSDASKLDPTVITKFETPPAKGTATKRVQLELEMAQTATLPGKVLVVMHNSALWDRPITWTKPQEKILDFLLAIGLPSDAKAVEAYFAAAAAASPLLAPVQVRAFNNDRPTHAKLAIVDDQAFLLGSPLIQEYYDRTRFQFDATGAALPPINNHMIGELTRGADGSCRRPIHDVSVLVRGPAVADIDRAFLLHWNQADKSTASSGGIAVVPAPPPIPSGIKVQVVRSLCRDRFDNAFNPDDANLQLAKGEKGILEAYLAAIGKAKRFIYIENQYFVHPDIVTAILNRMNSTPDLELILLLNNWADIPFYSQSLPIPMLSLILDWVFRGRQQKRLKQLLKGLLPSPSQFDKKIGAFTLWTHEDATGSNTRAPIINNYLHAKVAIIDDIWATVGSANLDVYSLSNEDNSEVNVLLFEDATTQITNFRHQLWAEHLGMAPAAITDSGFLKLWNDQANIKLKGLQESMPMRTAPRILPFPPQPHNDADIEFDVFKPNKFLAGLNIDTRKFNILQAETAFHFADGSVDPPK